jgi:hypothetical protein
MTIPYFCTFLIIPPLKKSWKFIWINLNFHHARNVCTKFDWNWPDVSFKKIFFFQYTNTHYKNSFPSCPPPWSSRTIICTSLNLHYFRKLSCKYELFWLCGSQGKKNSMISPNFCIFMSISPLKRIWTFIWTIQNSLYPRMICTKFDWNWLAGSGKYFFFRY